MKFDIIKFIKAANAVVVTFEHLGVTHTRNVNAVLTDKGKYDKDATAERVAEVAAGVAVKIALGVITNAVDAELQKISATDVGTVEDVLGAVQSVAAATAGQPEPPEGVSDGSASIASEALPA